MAAYKGGIDPTPERLKWLETCPKWEEYSPHTFRLKVDGGYIYRHGYTAAPALVFVPITVPSEKEHV